MPQWNVADMVREMTPPPSNSPARIPPSRGVFRTPEGTARRSVGFRTPVGWHGAGVGRSLMHAPQEFSDRPIQLPQIDLKDNWGGADVV